MCITRTNKHRSLPSNPVLLGRIPSSSGAAYDGALRQKSQRPFFWIGLFWPT